MPPVVELEEAEVIQSTPIPCVTRIMLSGKTRIMRNALVDTDSYLLYVSPFYEIRLSNKAVQ